MQKAQVAPRFSLVSILLILIVAVGGGLMSFLNTTISDSKTRQELAERTATIAVALDTQKIRQLKETPNAADSAAYIELKSKLTLLRQSSTDARTIYLAGLKDGDVYFMADSEAVDTKYYSAPGELYPEATNLFKSVFSSDSPVVEGPVSDSYGTWVSGLAPVVDTQTQQVIAVVGVDIDAAIYNQTVMQAAVIPLLVALIIIVIVGIYELYRRQQQELLQARSELISVASHELRTPITGMRWAAETLLRTAPEGPQRSMVQAMYDSIMKLQTGTEDILQLIRLQRGQKLHVEQIDITALIKEICATQDLVAKQKKVTILMDNSWPQTLPFTGDPQRMKRALQNVISNAVRYTKEATTVTLQYAKTAKTHRITITDQGIGIPQDEQQHIFTAFYQASNAKVAELSGTGLGLYLARSILRQHKGTVNFTSQENKGSTFFIELPATK